MAEDPWVELVVVATRVNGRYGVLLLRGVPLFVTLERTYETDNRVKIPLGDYECTRTTFHRGGYPTFEIHVPDHERILFHIANRELELEGCIAIGMSFAPWGVSQSRVGFESFMEAMGAMQRFTLRVR